LLDDLTIITVKRPVEQDRLRVYFIGDTHVGSPQFNEEAIRKKIQIIKDDDLGVVNLCGDLADYALRNSVSNIYQATLQPKEQQEYCYELFYPIKDKIAAAVPGNHEERITKEVGLCPLYDLCVRWGVPEVYRENIAITRYMFGTVKGNTTGRVQQNVFYGITTHGSSRNKHRKFAGGFDGADFICSGHSHLSEYSPGARLRIQRGQATAAWVPFKIIVTDANLKPGGYGLKHEYEIPATPELQYLELSTYRTHDDNRTLHRVMDYHTIQI